MKYKKFSVFNIVSTLLLLVITFIFVFPFYWVITGSFKEQRVAIKLPPEWFPRTPTIANFITLFKNGVTVGLKLENKGMITHSRVKNYRTEIIGDGGERVSGRWTGYVKTKMRTTYLTMPLLAAYRLDARWVMRGGAYVSYLTEGDFSGHVYDGYLREGDPTGPKIEFKDGRIATYDFSDRLRRFAYGAQMGISWRAFKHFNTFADLSWGLNDLFKSDFETVSFALYPIYLNAGFGYVF